MGVDQSVGHARRHSTSDKEAGDRAATISRLLIITLHDHHQLTSGALCRSRASVKIDKMISVLLFVFLLQLTIYLINSIGKQTINDVVREPSPRTGLTKKYPLEATHPFKANANPSKLTKLLKSTALVPLHPPSPSAAPIRRRAAHPARRSPPSAARVESHLSAG